MSNIPFSAKRTSTKARGLNDKSIKATWWMYQPVARRHIRRISAQSHTNRHDIKLSWGRCRTPSTSLSKAFAFRGLQHLFRHQHRYYSQNSSLVRYPGVKYAPGDITEVLEPFGLSLGAQQRYLVVLFGWLNAEERHMQKYVQLYTKRGFNVAYYVAPMMLAAVPMNVRHFSKRVSIDLANYLESLDSGKSTKTRLLFHVFSNNGYFNYCFLLHYLQNTPISDHFQLYHRIAGTIVDSAPSPLNPELLTRGFIGAFFAHRRLDHSYHPVISPILHWVWRTLLKIPTIKYHMQYANGLLDAAHDHDRWPYLFLFSSADDMIFASDTKEHIHKLISRGLNVEFFDFETTRHVEHYRQCPDLYIERLGNFIRKVDAIVTDVAKDKAG